MPEFSDGRGGRDGLTKDVVSKSMFDKLVAAGSPKAKRGHVEIWDKKVTKGSIEPLKDWSPRSFRGFVAHSPEDVEAALDKNEPIE